MNNGIKKTDYFSKKFPEIVCFLVMRFFTIKSWVIFDELINMQVLGNQDQITNHDRHNNHKEECDLIQRGCINLQALIS